ncbi:HAMP domain-containing sensor histidine kinase [Vagococcus carniphilus]|uniref:HAMP domain-containing sensor histidine kinase n=1 Tax=Vagococcus carniphilus TaxID=218144 RepID=UPI003B5AFE4D
MKSFQNIELPSKFSWRSISFKWTFLTAFAISILFSIFAIVTYQTSTNIMVHQEKTKFNRTMDEIENRLSRSEDPLTLNSTVFYLKESAGDFVGNQYYDRETLEASLMQLNSFISELSQPELNAKVYGADHRLLFETKNAYLPFDEDEQRTTNIQTFDFITGFVLLKPIYSGKTGKLVGYTQGFYELNNYYEVSKKLLDTLIILEVVGVISSIVIGFILSSYFTSPLRKMSKTLNSIEEAHKTGVRMPVPKANDEISDLANAFNDMLERMQKFILQQQQFVEDVSHELRTPVAVIEGHINLLNRWGKDDPEVLEESLEASLQEIVRMKSLVQEMLDLSRAEQSEFHYSDHTTLAREVIHTNVSNFRMLYPEFTFNLDDDIPSDIEVKIYRNHLEQILIILLDNAVKYSTDRKEVLISASLSYKSIEIMVQDFGEGISKENLDRIFNRFYRVDKARARNTGGNGLGLSIAEQLIDNYNGTISVKSHINNGAAFTFTLPIVEKNTSEDENLEEEMEEG